MQTLKRRFRRGSLYGTVALFCFFSASPFLWMLITMFKQDRDLYRPANNPFICNDPPTLDHLALLFQRTAYPVFVRNSMVIGVLVVLITLVISLPAAYSLARRVGRWGERAGILIFLVYLVLPTLLFIPPSRVITLMGFFKSMPRDLEEAAMVDGYSRLVGFIKVLMPLTIPGIIAVIVFAFTLTLDEFVYALAFVNASAQWTISVGVPTELIRGDVFYWQSLMAAAALVAIPVCIVYNLFLDRLISGFTLGAVKG
jgi:multiple sugar transport system permease protein